MNIRGGEIRADRRGGAGRDDDPASSVAPGPRTTSRRDRAELAAVNAFLERAAAGMDRVQLSEWLDEHVVAPGWMPAPTAVYEHGVGAVVLDGRKTRGKETGPLVLTARDRVVEAARGLLAKPSKDGFVVASLVRGRVRRCSEAGSYTPSPTTVDALSELVLALLACDVLRFREQYDAGVRICDRCDGISFVPRPLTCPICGEAGSQATSTPTT
jgi:hypothetical protein